MIYCQYDYCYYSFYSHLHRYAALLNGPAELVTVSACVLVNRWNYSVMMPGQKAKLLQYALLTWSKEIIAKYRRYGTVSPYRVQRSSAGILNWKWFPYIGVKIDMEIELVCSVISLLNCQMGKVIYTYELWRSCWIWPTNEYREDKIVINRTFF